MIIINYWQQVSKRYLISHLLLGVIAASFGLSVDSSLVTTLTTNNNSRHSEQIRVFSLQSVVSASQITTRANNPKVSPFNPIVQSAILAIRTTISSDLFFSPLLKQQVYCYWLVLIRPIRAGPTYF